ncbi:MAG: hypothetical protein A4S17_00120 [Proteobacteria bacterium HN_bin10]|nr:MAG: hypothetical protein A4S17_00120 [Proteobacteria bacterium HN_bin10]
MSAEIREHSYAVVARDLPGEGLRAGDVGVVVHIHRRPGESEPVGYMLETFTVDGEGLDTVSVPADAVRAATSNDMAHARPVAAE